MRQRGVLMLGHVTDTALGRVLARRLVANAKRVGRARQKGSIGGAPALASRRLDALRMSTGREPKGRAWPRWYQRHQFDR